MMYFLLFEFKSPVSVLMQSLVGELLLLLHVDQDIGEQEEFQTKEFSVWRSVAPVQKLKRIRA
jgi:hypothetical protein